MILIFVLTVYCRYLNLQWHLTGGIVGWVADVYNILIHGKMSFRCKVDTLE